MLKSSNWSQYVNSEFGADWAIGGPTLELCINAYNKQNKTNIPLPVISENGYGYDLPNNSFTIEEGDALYYNAYNSYHDLYIENYPIAATGSDVAAWYGEEIWLYNDGKILNAFSAKNLTSLITGWCPVVHISNAQFNEVKEGNTLVAYNIETN